MVQCANVPCACALTRLLGHTVFTWSTRTPCSLSCVKAVNAVSQGCVRLVRNTIRSSFRSPGRNWTCTRVLQPRPHLKRRRTSQQHPVGSSQFAGPIHPRRLAQPHEQFTSGIAAPVWWFAAAISLMYCSTEKIKCRINKNIKNFNYLIRGYFCVLQKTGHLKIMID